MALGPWGPVGPQIGSFFLGTGPQIGSFLGAQAPQKDPICWPWPKTGHIFWAQAPNWAASSIPVVGLKVGSDFLGKSSQIAERVIKNGASQDTQADLPDLPDLPDQVEMGHGRQFGP